ncbi:MAG: RHS repeat-associated core domain-containing protein, partial [Caldilineaceae bacterium]|nr:RHS repeat-associated core domain-containing protein [Caldilineaceae bacterium]
GATCASGNSLATDRQFTGQKYDVTGLHYYNARYFDDHIGQFVSPDSMVPDGTNLFDWNRYMYVRGRPLNANDPSGHTGAFGGPMFDESGGGGDANVLLMKTMADVATIMVGAEVARRGAQPLIAPQIHTPQESIPLAQSGFHATPPFALPEQTNDPLSTPRIDVPSSQATGFPLVQQQVGENVYDVTNNKGAKYPSTRVKGYGKSSLSDW